jgi:hypothetical protein
VTGGQDPRGSVAFEAAHRPQPRFQPAVISLDRVIRVPLDGMQRGGGQLIKDPRISRGPVSGDLDRDRARAQRAGEEPPGGGQIPAAARRNRKGKRNLIHVLEATLKRPGARLPAPDYMTASSDHKGPGVGGQPPPSVPLSSGHVL